MGLGLPRVIVNERDLSFYVDTLIKGVSCVAGVTQRGLVGKPMLVGSAQRFEQMFGKDFKNSDFPMIAKRALAYGATLWVSRVVHSDVDDETGDITMTAKAATVTLKSREEIPRDTLKITAGYRGDADPGAWGNGLSVKAIESALDKENLFSLQIFLNGALVETFSDVSMYDDSEYYIEKKKSEYVVFEDLGITVAGVSDRPAETDTAERLTGGDDGGELTDGDYIRVLKTFDEVDDAIQLAMPGVASAPAISAALAYCETRTDLLFVTETPFGLSPQEAVDFRLGQGDYTHAAFVSNYGAMYYPKLKVYDLLTEREKLISPVGDILGVMASNDIKENESFVPAGIRRGRVINALGVDVNVGSKGMSADANYICENQLNPVCVFSDAGTVVWGAQTLQRVPSLLREVNVRRLMIVVKKVVAAYARVFIHQPNDPRSWREFYRGLEPRFREWKAARWFYDYRIFCDQNAETLDAAKINTPESVQRGEFKCQIFVKPVVGIKWILIDANITRLDANFEESLQDAIGA